MEDLKTIKKIVEIRTGLTRIERKDKTRDYSFARFLYFKLASVMTPATYQSIGRCIHRDHSTVLYGLRQFDNMGHRFPLFNTYIEIKEELKLRKFIVEKFDTVEDCQNYYINEMANLKTGFQVELAKSRQGYERQHHVIERLKELSQSDYRDLLSMMETFIKVRTKLNSNVKILSK